ncbi:MAG TPA: biopolymer transporter ExbD [Polyangia bacterium]|nr:biopolymer transporter ExbD [Polyangia bacterium]
MGMSVGGHGAGGGARRGPQADINVTPLVDIVLVLLIIFMVMTPVMLKEIVAKVPQKQTEVTAQPPGENPIIVQLAADDTLTVNDEPVVVGDLAVRVAERLVHDRQKVVFFKVHDDANYGHAVRVMDMCKGAGAKVLGVITSEATRN